MPGSLGILTGAGISASPPASLPLGDEFHERLLAGCHTAARGFAGEAVTSAGLRRLRSGGRRNILGCIEDSLPDATVADVLGCMRVDIPTEAHLLCALHAARGTMQVTVNFDDGIERAYRLLRGEAELPGCAPIAYCAALPAWRAAMPDAGPLRVVSTPAELRSRRYDDRPLLVKLRGGAAHGTDGSVVPLRPAIEDLEATRLDEDRLAALREVAASDHLLVVGHSGRDLDCFESLRGLLRPSSFSWVALELPDAVAARVRAIDPAQPSRGTASEVLRAHLPGPARPPVWPRAAPPRDGDTTFGRRFATWWRQVPVAAAAEAYARLLGDAGCYQEAEAILRSLLARQDPSLPAGKDQVRVRLRLAAVLARRGQDRDLREATGIFAAAARDPAGPPPLRAFARTRWAECRVDTPPVTAGRALRAATGCTAALVRAGDRRVAARALAGLGYVAQRFVDERVQAGRPIAPVLAAVTRGGLAVLRAARAQTRRAGTACRQTDLELAVLRMELRLSLLTGARVPADAPQRLAAAARAYAHRGDGVGQVRVAAVAALSRGEVPVP